MYDREDGENVRSILNKERGVLIPIEEVNNTYEIDMFIRKTENVNAVEEENEEQDKARYTGYWEVLGENETVDMSHFFTGLV